MADLTPERMDQMLALAQLLVLREQLDPFDPQLAVDQRALITELVEQNALFMRDFAQLAHHSKELEVFIDDLSAKIDLLTSTPVACDRCGHRMQRGIQHV